MGIHPDSRCANLRHTVGRGTVANILKENGIEPPPQRGKHTRWSTFLKAHWKILAASDFFTIEFWTPRGLMTYYVLFVMSIADRLCILRAPPGDPTRHGCFRLGVP